MAKIFVYLIISSFTPLLMANSQNSCTAAISADLMRISEQAQDSLVHLVTESASEGRFFVVKRGGKDFALAVVDGRSDIWLKSLTELLFSPLKIIKRIRFPNHEEQEQSTFDEKGSLVATVNLGLMLLGAVGGYHVGQYFAALDHSAGFATAFAAGIVFPVTSHLIEFPYQLREWYQNLTGRMAVTRALDRASMQNSGLGHLPLLILQTPTTSTPESIDRLLRSAGIEEATSRISPQNLVAMIKEKVIAPPSLPVVKQSLATASMKQHSKTRMLIQNVNISSGKPAVAREFLQAIAPELGHPLNNLAPTDHVDFVYMADRDYSGKPDPYLRDAPIGYLITRNQETSIYLPTISEPAMLNQLKNLIFITLGKEHLCDPGFPVQAYARDEVFITIGKRIAEATARVADNASSNLTRLGRLKAPDPDVFLSTQECMNILGTAAAAALTDVQAQSNTMPVRN